ncbi:MAG: YgfZ/GcvT domain-containing protein [Gammaproteobacteria bacterium]
MSISGSDATTFLEAQSMTALAALEDRRLCRCGFADSKGRVIAVATVWHTGTDWRLILPTEEAEWFVSHLLRFRFRSHVEIGMTDWAVAALFGESAATAFETINLKVPDTDRINVANDLEIAAIPDGRYLITSEAPRMVTTLNALAVECADADRTHWHGVCMQAGEVALCEATRGQFLPQWLNFDTHGVIAWNKGCYPGQEIIARLQHRGTVKRRMTLLATESDAPTGARIEVNDVPVEMVNHGILPDGEHVTQVVAPYPLDSRLKLLQI